MKKQADMSEALWEYVEKCRMHSMKMKPIMTIATDKAVPASGAIQNSVVSFLDNVAVMSCPQVTLNPELTLKYWVGFPKTVR